MLNNHLKYPQFDNLEYTPELEYGFTRYQKLSPAKPGDVIDSLNSQKNKSKWHPYFYENIYNSSGLSFTYAKKPLVLYFYSKSWGDAAIAHLKLLNSIQQEIQYHQGNVLIITDDTDELRQVLWDHSLTLQVAEDKSKELASLFGIYSENSPAWSRYAGIEENVPLPAVYVLDHSRQVVFEYANEDINTGLPANGIIASTAQSHEYLFNKKSA